VIAVAGELLLDTHVLIWMVEGNSRLSEEINDLLRRGSREGRLVVSAITPWEVGVLTAKTRISLQMDIQLWVNNVLALPGVRLQPLLPEIAVASTRLPWEMHADPADRILAATARHLGATLVTADEHLLRYADEGFLRCQRAI
jgi:PIN domain nuclease of toxin-antitoxin system